jgi:hypothetical protein
MDILGQINFGEMLSGLAVTSFLILLDASIVVVCSMVMFPLIDLAFKKKAKPAPRPAQAETWRSGQPWLALRSNIVRPDVAPHSSPLPLLGMAHEAFAQPPLEHITPLMVRSLVPKGSEGAATGPVTAPLPPVISGVRASETLSLGNLFSAKRRLVTVDKPRSKRAA